MSVSLGNHVLHNGSHYVILYNTWHMTGAWPVFVKWVNEWFSLIEAYIISCLHLLTQSLTWWDKSLACFLLPDTASTPLIFMINAPLLIPSPCYLFLSLQSLSPPITLGNSGKNVILHYLNFFPMPHPYPSWWFQHIHWWHLWHILFMVDFFDFIDCISTTCPFSSMNISGVFTLHLQDLNFAHLFSYICSTCLLS